MTPQWFSVRTFLSVLAVLVQQRGLVQTLKISGERSNHFSFGDHFY